MLPLNLELLKNCRVEFNTGNRGDGVIKEGAKQLLNIGISDTLIFIGAGGFSKGYKHNIERFKKVYFMYKKVYIASVSFDTSDNDVKNFLSNLPMNTYIICRDEESYRQCLKFTPRVYLHDDFAFSFNYEPYKKQGIGTLHAFRGDKEKTQISENNDLSIGTEKEWEQFIKDIAEYDIIHTNRLHIGIVGTMLGKQVYLYPNSYHKNRSVYDYSLKKYPNCKFCDKIKL